MEVKIQHYWRRRRNQNRLLLCRLLRAVPNGFTCLGPIVLETMLLLFVVNHLFSFLGLHTSTHFQTVIPTSGFGLSCSLLSSARRFNFSFFKNFLVGKKGEHFPIDYDFFFAFLCSIGKHFYIGKYCVVGVLALRCNLRFSAHSHSHCFYFG